jgi:hypothetical protein
MRSTPQVVFKTHQNASVYDTAAPAPQLSSDDIAEAVAETLAEEGDEIRREFEARVAKLEGKVDALLSLLAGDPARSKSIRKGLQDHGQQLLEPPTTNRHHS